MRLLILHEIPEPSLAHSAHNKPPMADGVQFGAYNLFNFNSARIQNSRGYMGLMKGMLGIFHSILLIVW